MSNVFVDPALLPRERLSDCFRSVLRTPGIHTYYDAQGYPPLREVIAHRLERRGIPARPEHVIITTGSQQALDIVCRALVRRRIATENPAYAIGKRLFELNGLEVTGLAFDPFTSIDLEGWEALLTKTRPGALYLTSSFQNPTGYSYSTAELLRLLQLSQQLDFGLIEDDWGSDMLSFSEFRPPARALGGDDVLYINSFTKKLLPALRVGYLLANERTVASLVEAKRVATLGNPTLIEAALFEFLDRGYFDTHLQDLQRELDQRYQLSLDLLEETMPPGVRWTTPGGGPILWVELPREVDLTLLTARLSQKQVLINRCASSFFGPPQLHGFKLGYAASPPDDLQRGIRAVATEIRELLEVR